jgi:fatty-acyl-CoA synthase
LTGLKNVGKNSGHMETNRRPLTPISFLERSARVFPDRIAVVDHATRFTYREFHERARSMAAGLRANGIRAGDRVAFLAINSEPLLTAHFGVPMSGAVLVAINPRLAPGEILYILKDAEVAALVADPALLANLPELPAKCPELRRIVTLETGHSADFSYTDLLTSGADREEAYEIEDEDALISLNYTSGTSGHLKGVMYTHRGAYLNALGNALEVELTSGTRYLWTLPMFHCNGWCYSWAVTAVGGKHICLERPVPAEVFHLIKSETITHLCAAPTVLIDLAQYAASHQITLGAPLTIMTGGAAPAPQVIRNIEAIGAKVIHLYGLTETYGPSTFCQWQPEWYASGLEEQLALKARQGVADLMVEQRVVRDDMTDVEPDSREIGEIVIRGNAIMKGYYRDPEATQHAFRGGWFHTGDLAVLHPDGYVEVKDRAKDIIISGGENVSTLEVERVIYTHPAVLEVAVVSSPHERFGEVPKAFVVLKPDTALNAETLHTYCRERLAGFKCPRRIDFVNELPKTSTGKIQKYLLREREWNNHCNGGDGSFK